jgi:small neutral amino acid transporter SnatA (MarC family)
MGPPPKSAQNRPLDAQSQRIALPLVAERPKPCGTLLLLIAIVIVFAVTYIIFYFSKTISKYISYTAMLVITRLFGLLLASIAIGMITTGLYNILYDLLGIFF